MQHDQQHYIPVAGLAKNLGKTVTLLGYLVTLKHVYTAKQEPMCFGTFLDRDGDFLDTVHFPDSLRRYPFQKSGFYILKGKVIEEFGVFSVDVHRMRKIGYFEDKAKETGTIQATLRAV